MNDSIENKVASSGLITINLEDFYQPGERILFDIKDLLFQGLILREKDFREYIKQEDWKKYQDKYVAITCSADAIIPTWAYMLLSISLEPYAGKIIFGNLEMLETLLYTEQLEKLDMSAYKDARIVVKGCGKLPIPTQAFVDLARRLKPVVKSLMYGEPCSTVPLFKAPKNQ